MQAKDIMHPEDAKALQVLRKLKGFDELIRLSMEYGYEQLYRGENLGMLLKVNTENYPVLFQTFKEVVKTVGIREPELYIYNDQQKVHSCGSSIALPSRLVLKWHTTTTAANSLARGWFAAMYYIKCVGIGYAHTHGQ